MFGVVSLLDDVHDQLVKGIWQEFEDRFGISGIHPTPIPHFSYQIAGHYDLEKLAATLQRTAHEIRPFRVTTAGLGIFSGTDPVLYVPVVRSPRLTEIHHRIWQAVLEFGANVAPYYAPDRWMPHITLADENVDHDHLPQLVRFLSDMEFAWEITVNNLAVIHDTDQHPGLYLRVEFGA